MHGGVPEGHGAGVAFAATSFPFSLVFSFSFFFWISSGASSDPKKAGGAAVFGRSVLKAF